MRAFSARPLRCHAGGHCICRERDHAGAVESGAGADAQCLVPLVGRRSAHTSMGPPSSGGQRSASRDKGAVSGSSARGAVLPWRFRTALFTLNVRGSDEMAPRGRATGLAMLRRRPRWAAGCARDTNDDGQERTRLHRERLGVVLRQRAGRSGRLAFRQPRGRAQPPRKRCRRGNE